MAQGGRGVLGDPQLQLMIGLLAGLAALAFWRGGAPLVRSGFAEGARALWQFGALIAVSFFAAGLAQVLIPREWIQRALGEQAGFAGILVATVAGAATPAGPFVSLPIAAALRASGASAGAVVAYLTAWALLAVHRLVAWESPILGPRFALFRWGVSLGLPLLAGILARMLSRLA